MTTKETIYSWLQIPLALELLLSHQKEMKKRPPSPWTTLSHINIVPSHLRQFLLLVFVHWHWNPGSSVPPLFLYTDRSPWNSPGMEWTVKHRDLGRAPLLHFDAISWCLRCNLHRSAVIKCHLSLRSSESLTQHCLIAWCGCFLLPAWQRERFSDTGRNLLKSSVLGFLLKLLIPSVWSCTQGSEF